MATVTRDYLISGVQQTFSNPDSEQNQAAPKISRTGPKQGGGGAGSVGDEEERQLDLFIASVLDGRIIGQHRD
jgi:hypothetical protein